MLRAEFAGPVASSAVCHADAADVMLRADLAPEPGPAPDLTTRAVPEHAVVIPCFLGAALTNSMAPLRARACRCSSAALADLKPSSVAISARVGGAPVRATDCWMSSRICF